MQRAGYKYCAIRPSAGQRETVFDGCYISALPVGGALFLFKFLIWEVTILKSLEKFETCDPGKELKGREGVETKNSGTVSRYRHQDKRSRHCSDCDRLAYPIKEKTIH